MSQFLLEIGMEEIPARFLVDLRDQLKDRVEDFLTASRINFESLESFATPRRLAVRVNGLAEGQTSLEEEIRGPSLKVAKNEDGTWSKATLGFLRGQGLEEEAVFVKEVKGTDYIFVNKKAAQEKTSSVLKNIVSVLEDMHFPVSMRWGNQQIEYIRPVHWLVSLLDEQVIPISFARINSDRYTRGHRFLGSREPLCLPHASEYEKILEEGFVIADFEERQNEIYHQIQEIAEDNNWDVPDNPELLEEVTALVEWPTAFYGDFEEVYLQIPHIMVITAMRDHQRYFYALNSESKDLLPVFISVRNGDENHIENVVKGNQKVLRARLADSLFFYEEDLKHTLEYFVQQLDRVNEHFKLGTFAQKQERVSSLLMVLASQIDNLPEEDFKAALNASEIYKFDLMTQAVDEFSELQGQIGGIYAEHFGESEKVAQAISEQYLPTSAGGDLPETKAGALLALADKIDTILAYFSVGLIPTGSNDPYALRRQTMGVVEIILKQNWSFDLAPLISSRLESLQTNLKEVSSDSVEEITDQAINFIQARIQVYLENKQVSYDVIQSVLGSSHLNVNRLVESALAIQKRRNQNEERFRQVIENLSRVVNLGEKVTEVVEIKPELAQTDSETELIGKVMMAASIESLEEQLNYYLSISPIISEYFEENMVNADDESLRFNRYQLMYQLTQAIIQIFDPRKLVTK